MRTAHEIRSDVVYVLGFLPDVDPSRIEVVADENGTVCLDGSVRFPVDGKLVQAVARRVPGVRRVTANLEVVF